MAKCHNGNGEIINSALIFTARPARNRC